MKLGEIIVEFWYCRYQFETKHNIFLGKISK